MMECNAPVEMEVLEQAAPEPIDAYSVLAVEIIIKPRHRRHDAAALHVS